MIESEVREFLSRYEAASNSRSLAAVEPFIHPNAVFRFTDGDFAGLAAVRGAFEKTWAYDVEDEKYFTTDLRVLSLDAASASVTYDWTWTGLVKGRYFRTTGRGTAVIVRSGGTLQLIHEHLSHTPD